MDFRIAYTFTDSLGRLTGEEQRSVKTAAFDLQMNPAQPSLQFHRVEKSKDRNFWSARVSLDLRLIVHRTGQSLLLCYVAHHDDAYEWAHRRKLETHPNTGAAQIVELRETVQEIVVPRYVEAAPVKPALFAATPESEILACGVPPEWLGDVRLANEDSLLALAEHLPAEAAEALLELAVGGKPKSPPAVRPGGDPFAHPDAQRRFRVMRNVEELERALDYPWDKWTVFLHPSQRQLVEREFKGPARVAGSAGTGKTIVALHRAVCLARKHEDARILFTTFSEPLAQALFGKLQRLIGNEPRLAERIDVCSMASLGRRLWRAHCGGAEPKLASDADVREAIAGAIPVCGGKFSRRFLFIEWRDIIDAWQLPSWESYRDVPRLGRRTRLPEARRLLLWELFASVRERLSTRGFLTESAMLTRLAAVYGEVPARAEALGKLKLPPLVRARTPYDFAVVDEAQDVSVAQLRFLAALGRDRPDALFFAGDLGQRIFQTPFSWKALGVDIRGRSTTLKVNYRTSHQIRTSADRLLDSSVTDGDGIGDERKGTTSVFNGPVPEVKICGSSEDEIATVASWIKRLINEERLRAEEIGVVVRGEGEFERARAAARGSGVAISTMHLAKGLEFRAVAVMACDDEVIPSQERIESASEDAELEEVYNTERHLLYVACTRARDFLLVTGVEPASEFLDDLLPVRRKEGKAARG